MTRWYSSICSATEVRVCCSFNGGGGAAPSPYVAMGGRAGAEQWRKVVHACEVVVAQRCVGRGVAAALLMLRTGAGGSDES